MSRVRNADEFLLAFRNISAQYDEFFAPRIAGVRQKYIDRLEPNFIDSSLEAHARAYFVNAFLAALNWRLDAKPSDSLPNLIPEVPIRSEKEGTIRFLDYLGLERDTMHPLLIVETKKPSIILPQVSNSIDTCSEVISKCLSGECLDGVWHKWLNEDHGDYVRSAAARTGIAPKRTIITNGLWLILFLDPADSFLEGGTRDPNKILVFADRKDIEDHFTDIFRYLEHHEVLGQAPVLNLGSLPFFISPNEVDRAMHGLHIKYIEQATIYACKVPIIKIAPIIFIRSRHGTWFRVEAPTREYELKHEYRVLAKHLKDIRRVARELLSEVNRRLDSSLKAIPLLRHYENDDEFATCPGVVDLDGNEYLILTGDNTHFIIMKSSISRCRYHSWDACNKDGVAFNNSPIVAQSTSPRSYFISGDYHHCAHMEVGSAKENRIKNNNRNLGPLRSGRECQAYCEIWRIERYLCCRLCSFEIICTRSSQFRLPCKRSKHNKYRKCVAIICKWIQYLAGKCTTTNRDNCQQPFQLMGSDN